MTSLHWKQNTDNKHLETIVNSTVDNLDIPLDKTNIKQEFINLNNFLNTVYKIYTLDISDNDKINLLTNFKDNTNKKFITVGNAKKLLNAMNDVINPPQKGGGDEEFSSVAIPAKFVSDSIVKTVDGLKNKKSNTIENSKDSLNSTSDISELLNDYINKLKDYRDKPDFIEFLFYILNKLPFVGWIYDNFILTSYTLSKKLYIDSSLNILGWYKDFYKIIDDLSRSGKELIDSLSKKLKNKGNSTISGYKKFIYNLIGNTCPKASQKSIYLQSKTIGDKTFLIDNNNNLFTNDVNNPIFIGKWSPKLNKIFWHPAKL